MTPAPPAIDLTEQRYVGDILGGAFKLYRARFGLFATIAFSVVIPIDLVVYGVAGELLGGTTTSPRACPSARPLRRR